FLSKCNLSNQCLHGFTAMDNICFSAALRQQLCVPGGVIRQDINQRLCIKNLEGTHSEWIEILFLDMTITMLSANNRMLKRRPDDHVEITSLIVSSGAQQ